MNQFDVFRNPITASKTVYPFVINLQSNVSCGLKSRIVAPLTRLPVPAGMSRNLVPEVSFDGEAHTVVMGRTTTMRSSILSDPIGSGESARSQLLAAIDFLFFGI